MWGGCAQQIALHFHSYLRPHFPTKLTHRTRKKRNLYSVGTEGMPYLCFVCALCLIKLIASTILGRHKIHASRQLISSFAAAKPLLRASDIFPILVNSADKDGISILAIALQRVGQGCPLRTFPFALWTWTKRTPKGSSYFDNVYGYGEVKRPRR